MTFIAEPYKRSALESIDSKGEIKKVYEIEEISRGEAEISRLNPQRMENMADQMCEWLAT